MKHYYFIHLVSLFLTIFVSCQKADDSISIENEKLPMSVIARIGDAEPATARYAGTLPNSVSFTEGDAIGIFMHEEGAVDKGDVVKWTLGDIKWGTTTNVSWPDRVKKYSFKAFYPHDDETTYTYSDIPMPSLLGQDGTLESVASRDFLIASTTQNYGTNGVVLFQGEGKAFYHVSALVHLTIKDEADLADATLTGISIEGGNIVAPSYYSFETPGVTISPNQDSDLLSVTLNQKMDGNQDYYFVLNAKNTTNENIKFTLQYTTNNKKYIAESNSFSGNVFTSGAQHDFTVSIINNQISITGATINEWTPDDNETNNDITINNPQINEDE